MDCHPTGRIASVDGLRGLLAIVVVVYHFDHYRFAAFTESPSRIAVATFFIMSGYVLTRAWSGNFPVFLVRRFIRLWPLFATCLALAALINRQTPQWSLYFWYPFIYDPDQSPILNLNGPMWSLFIEAWAMLFMPLIVWCGRSSARVIVASAIAIAAARFEHWAIYAPLFIAGAFLAGCDFNLRVLNGPLVQWCGKISYSLYLSHWVVFRACDLWAPNFAPWIEIPLAFAVARVLCALVDQPSIALSRRCAKFLERVRFGDGLRRAAVLLPSR